MQTTFFNYLNRAKHKIICADDKRLSNYNNKNLITFAINSDADYKAENIINNNGKYSFSCNLKSGKHINVDLKVYGFHNIYNALVNIAVFDGIFNFDSDIIKSGRVTMLKRRKQ